MHETTNQSDADWLTADEAVQLLPGVSIRSLQRWAREKRVPAAVLPNGRYRFRRSDVEALLQPIDPSSTRNEQVSA